MGESLCILVDNRLSITYTETDEAGACRSKIVKSKQLNIIDESQKPYITILLLAWLVFVEQIFSTLVSFIDTAMVGSLGAEATASISISNTPILQCWNVSAFPQPAFW